MTVNFLALLVGLFGIPIALLVYGKRLRRRNARVQKAFWGAAIGHLIAATIAIWAGLVSAEGWNEGDRLRGFAGYWALVILPIAGALMGALLASPKEAARKSGP